MVALGAFDDRVASIVFGRTRIVSFGFFATFANMEGFFIFGIGRPATMSAARSCRRITALGAVTVLVGASTRVALGLILGRGGERVVAVGVAVGTFAILPKPLIRIRIKVRTFLLHADGVGETAAGASAVALTSAAHGLAVTAVVLRAEVVEVCGTIATLASMALEGRDFGRVKVDVTRTIERGSSIDVFGIAAVGANLTSALRGVGVVELVVGVIVALAIGAAFALVFVITVESAFVAFGDGVVHALGIYTRN